MKKGVKKQVRKPVSSNFVPKRLAISYQPPMIIMQYLVTDTGKLYHHKMRLDSIFRRAQVSRQDVLNYIKNKHFQYFINGKIKDVQLLKFIDRIMIRNGKGNQPILQTRQNPVNEKLNTHQQKLQKLIPEKDDFQYLNDNDDDQQYQEDYQHYQQQKPQVSIKQRQSKKIQQNKGKSNAFLTYCQQYEEQSDGAGQAEWDLDMDQDADFV